MMRARGHAQAVLAITACVWPAMVVAQKPPQDARLPQGLPAQLRDVGIVQRLDEQLPLDLSFRDEQGRVVQLDDYFGERPVILSLAYYECPMLCTQVLSGLARSLAELSFDVGREFEVLTVSFDPQDTPDSAAAKKATYLQRYERPGAEAGWHFLTGEPEAIDALTRAVGFRYSYDEETKQFAHASGVMVLTPQGRLARYFYGIDYPPRDLRLGLVEASQNRIGSPVDQLLLYCYRYDPASGKYGAVVLNMVRVGGALTVVGLAALLLLLRRRGSAARGAGV